MPDPPGTVIEVAPELLQRRLDLPFGEQVEDGDAVADGLLQIGLGAAPVSLVEAVAAVVGTGTDRSSISPSNARGTISPVEFPILRKAVCITVSNRRLYSALAP